MSINKKTLEKYNGVLVRPETMDKYVVDECVSTYKLLAVGPKDTVLDVGANIGAFSRLACELGAKRVVGYEPFPDNAELAKLNAPTAEIVAAALVTAKQNVVDFYVNVRGINHGAHSTVPTRGRELITVAAEQWSVVLKKVKPTKIKMDCEGAEFDLLSEPLPTCVKAVALEIHLQKTLHRQSAPALHQSLLDQGFECLKDPTHAFTTKAWHVIGVYRRK